MIKWMLLGAWFVLAAAGSYMLLYALVEGFDKYWRR